MDTARAWAEIDLDALTHNLGVVRGEVGAGTSLLLVAKADAYGHGAVAVAHRAAAAGVLGIAVSTTSEAVELRRAGVPGRLLVLGAVLGDDAAAALEWDVEIGVSSAELCLVLERSARRRRRRARVHLKIDTGMHRLGVAPEEALGVLASIHRSSSLELVGVMTHLAATHGGSAPDATAQLGRFRRILEEARARGLLGPGVCIHAASSAAVLCGLGSGFAAVRVGIAAYGVLPDPRLVAPALRPVMAVRSRVVHLQAVAEGTRVGYGGAWTAKRRSRIATLSIGYDDGVAWRLGNRGDVLVRGHRAPIAGRISMDYTTVDVTDVPGVSLGDVATWIGGDGAEEIRVEELAARAGTVPYEILCSIGKRVPRRYPQRPVGPVPSGSSEGGTSDGEPPALPAEEPLETS